jgi:dipeptidase E
MKLYLTSTIGGSIKEDGVRKPGLLLPCNGFTYLLGKDWVKDSKVLIITASPGEYERNDSILACMREAFPMSGLSISFMDICDDRKEYLADRINEMDAVLLSGGHVPTQNAFFQRIGLKEKIANYHGIVVAYSAGSMNCAELVYASPEVEGEALDPNYKRWIPGLGLTKVNIFPHFEDMGEEWLDGMRVVEDIVYKDSFFHEIIALNNGAFIVVENGKHTLYGEAYRIKDGNMEQICQDGTSVIL